MRSYDSETSDRPHTIPRVVDQDRENDRQVQRLLSDRGSGGDSRRRPRDVRAVIHLQRMAGNTAVTRFVALQRAPQATVDESALDQTYLLPDLQFPTSCCKAPRCGRT